VKLLEFVLLFFVGDLLVEVEPLFADLDVLLLLLLELVLLLLLLLLDDLDGAGVLFTGALGVGGLIVGAGVDGRGVEMVPIAIAGDVNTNTKSNANPKLTTFFMLISPLVYLHSMQSFLAGQL
jgi:hypothetical protein